MKTSIQTTVFSLSLFTPTLLAEEWNTATQEEWTSHKAEGENID